MLDAVEVFSAEALGDAFDLLHILAAVDQIFDRFRQQQNQQHRQHQRCDRAEQQHAVPAVARYQPEEIAPPAAAPSGKPQYMVLIASERQRCGAYSEISVMALGMAAPRPRPVRKRHSVRLLSEPA